jgi:N-methylhydantoinase B
MALFEMEKLLVRTAMSPFIREKRDFHVALADSAGRVVAASGGMVGEFISPIIKQHPLDTMQPGDIYWYNDCYGSRGIVSHSPDQAFVAPVFFAGAVIGFAQSWAHFNDIGGMYPGTLSPDAISIYQEGTMVPVVRLYAAGIHNDDMQRMFEMNSRYPQMIRGDIRACVAAVRLGERRLIELFTRFSAPVAFDAFEQMFDRTRTLLTAKLRELFAEGTYSFTEVVASDGKGNGPFHIRMDLIVSPDRVILDATRTDDQAVGPINFLMQRSFPASMLGRYLLSLIPGARANHGVELIIDEVKIREGSLLQPRFPAPLGMRGITAVRAMNCVLGLVNEATGGMGGASNSAYVIYNMRGRADGAPFLLSDGVAIGYGARNFADGLDAVYLVGQQNYPAEFMETAYPIRMRAYGLAQDSGGPGRWRGGCGVFREMEVLADEAMLSIRIDGVFNPPWGAAGGHTGRGGRAVINPATSEERVLGALSDGAMLKHGDIFRIETVGGGGWGDPLDRDPESVLADVRGGFISAASALADYGVALSGDVVDLEATAQLRCARATAASDAH